MKILFIFIFSFFIFNFASAISDLPPCKGKNYDKYVNCYGSYKDKDYSKIYNYPGLTNNYIGEFGDLPGLSNGKGIAEVYLNGEYGGTYIGNFKNDKLDGLVTYIENDFIEVSKYNLDVPVSGTSFMLEYNGVYVGQLNRDGDWHGLGTVINGGAWSHKFFKNGEEQETALSEINHSPCKGQDRSKWYNCTLLYEYFNVTRNQYIVWKSYQNATEIYSGEMGPTKNKKPMYNGKGILELILDGELYSIYIGEFENGERNGYGTEYYIEYNSIYVGQFKDNQWNGYGNYFQRDEKYIGYFKNDNYHGLGIRIDKDTKDKKIFRSFELSEPLYEVKHNVMIVKDLELGCKSNKLDGADVKEFNLKLKLDKNLNTLTVSSKLVDGDYGKLAYYSNFIVAEILLNSDEYLIGFYRDYEQDKNFHFMLDKFNGKFKVVQIFDNKDKYLIKTLGRTTLNAQCQNYLY